MNKDFEDDIKVVTVCKTPIEDPDQCLIISNEAEDAALRELDGEEFKLWFRYLIDSGEYHHPIELEDLNKFKERLRNE